MANRQRHWGALLSIASLLGCLAVAEWALRGRPLPRIQAVFPDQAELITSGDEVFWRSHSRGEREQIACVEREGQAAVAILGSSILFGVQLDVSETLGAHLEPVVDGCVVNLAQPASSFQTQAATARHSLAALHPQIVIWEVWKNSPNDFTLINGAAYNFGNLSRDEGGVPSPLGLPPPLNRTLFGVSSIYRFIAVSQARDRPETQGGAAEWVAFTERALPQLRALAGDARLILPMMPPLSVPFAQTAAHPPPGYTIFAAAAAAQGIETIDVAAALSDADHEALRLDPCCHLNAAGQAALGVVIAAAISPPAPDEGPP